MTQANLVEMASNLPDAWQSRILGQVGTASIKVLRMSDLPLEEEVHDASEALVVLDGHLELEVAGRVMPLNASDLCMVPAGTPHAVLPGSMGTLLIIEVENDAG